MAIKPATDYQVSRVAALLPSVDDDPDTWDTQAIKDNWSGGIAGTLRNFWYQKCSNTAGYLDLTDAGGSLPITQIHRQAKEMLDYWDIWILKHGAMSDPGDASSMGITASIGKIKNRKSQGNATGIDRWNSRTPYTRT